MAAVSGAALRQHSRSDARRNTAAPDHRRKKWAHVERDATDGLDAGVTSMCDVMRGNGWKLVGAVVLATVACGGSSRSADGQAQPPASPAATAEAAQPAPSPGGNVSGRACATPDDSTGASISGTFRSPPEPLYAAGSAALRDLGYAVLETVPPREMITAPSYAWPRGSERESWHGSEHPGIEVFLHTRTAGDSTAVTIGARALCKVAGAAGGPRESEVGKYLEGVVTLTAMNALINRLRTPPS